MSAYSASMELDVPCTALTEHVLSASILERRWYVVYTCANHEKRIAKQLAIRGFEYFLPLYESRRKWKDRTIHLQLPLFPGYIFVHFDLKDRLSLLRLPGVVRLVGFDGKVRPLPEEELAHVRAFLSLGFRVEPHPYLQYLRAGRRVRVIRGPLEGMAGVIVRRKNRTRFVVILEAIQRAVAVEIDGLELEADLRQRA